MKNLLNDAPNMELNARMNESIVLVEQEDLSGKRILDIGCGYGWFENAILKNDIAGIAGIEITEDDIATAREHIRDDRAVFSVGSAIEIPFEDDSFDVVVAWEVIEHIPKGTEDRMFTEVRRVLKPGGTFYLSTPYDSLLSKLLDPAWWLIGHRHYSEDRLRRFGLDNAFSTAEITRRGGVWSVMATLNMYVSKWILRRKPVFARHFDQKERAEYAREKGIATIFAKFENRP